MRRSFACMTTLIMLLIVLGSSASGLEGCLTESAISSAAAKLMRENWQNVSLSKLRTIWPTELSGLNCEADVCHSVWSMDRIIAGQCQCCTTFAFKTKQKKGRTRVEQLDEVVLNYSTVDRNQLVQATKKIVGSMGLRGADVAIIGSTDEQSFHWANPTSGNQELSTIEVHFKHQGGIWKVFLSWARFPSKPSESKH